MCQPFYYLRSMCISHFICIQPFNMTQSFYVVLLFFQLSLQKVSSVHGDKGDGKRRKKKKTWFVLSAVAFPFLCFDSYEIF
jgi:hypothetical protein